jgi:hypothetical protein
LEISSGQFFLFLNFSFGKIFTRNLPSFLNFLFVGRTIKKGTAASIVKLALFLSAYFVFLLGQVKFGKKKCPTFRRLRRCCSLRANRFVVIETLPVRLHGRWAFRMASKAVEVLALLEVVQTLRCRRATILRTDCVGSLPLTLAVGVRQRPKALGDRPVTHRPFNSGG